MTDVVQYQEPAASELEQWGRDASLISQVAINLVKTNFVPASYNGDPAQVTAAILTGQEIGLQPMAALRSIDIIQGVPAMRAIALRALVQSHGHEIWTEESTSQRAVVKAQRKGSTRVETSTWDIPRAQAMSLLGKDNWKKQPTAMLLARATSEAARLVAADVLLGIPYSIEELEDLDVAPVEGPAPVKRPTSRAARKPLPEKAEATEPDLPGDPVVEAQAALEAASTSSEIDDAQREVQRLADEALAEEQRRRAAEHFEKQPELVEPEIEWEVPADEDTK